MFLHKILQLDKFEGADYKYDNILFKFQSKNTQIRRFSPKIKSFHFFTKFRIWQVWGCWYQIWQYSFQILAQKYRNKAFLVPNLGNFILPWNFGIRKIQGCWFQIWQYYYQIPVQKYPNQAILVPNLRILFLHQTSQEDKFEDADFKYNKNIFKFQPKNMQIRHFSTQILAFLFYHEILQLDKFGMLISNVRILFSSSSQKYPNKLFLVPNLGIFVFFMKFFFFTIFVFAPNFATRQTRGRKFQIWQ